MSVCRWSCDDFKSDVYIYYSVRGITTHVKGGESYDDRNEKTCLERLEYLRDKGKHIPDHAFEQLREEGDRND